MIVVNGVSGECRTISERRIAAHVHGAANAAEAVRRLIEAQIVPADLREALETLVAADRPGDAAAWVRVVEEAVASSSTWRWVDEEEDEDEAAVQTVSVYWR